MVLGKLSHHLFIQSTEDGVSAERGAASHKPPWEYWRSRAVFLATSTVLCLKKMKPVGKTTFTAPDLLSS